MIQMGVPETRVKVPVPFSDRISGRLSLQGIAVPWGGPF